MAIAYKTLANSKLHELARRLETSVGDGANQINVISYVSKVNENSIPREYVALSATNEKGVARHVYRCLWYQEMYMALIAMLACLDLLDHLGLRK